jgi:hypothetical protein
MQKLLFTILIGWLGLIPVLLSQTQVKSTQHQILGKWQAADDDSRQIEFSVGNDGLFWGKTISSSRDGKMVAGHLLFQNCRFDTQSKTWKGTMQPPNSSLQINVEISISAANKMKAVARKLLLSKTFYFTKMQ